MPNPPPGLSSRSSNPNACASRPPARRPARSSRGTARARRSASQCARASPPARRPGAPWIAAPPPRPRPVWMLSPNLVSSTPVWMCACVCASTPGATRSSTACSHAPFARQSRQALDLFEVVDHDARARRLRAPSPARPRPCCCRGSRSRSVGKPLALRGVQLAARDDVQAQPFVGDDAQQPWRAVRLARVAHQRFARVGRAQAVAVGARPLRESSPRRRRTAACRTRPPARRGRSRRAPGARPA